MGKIMLNGEMFGIEVEGNPTIPSGASPTDLSSLKIDNNYYNVSGGGGGSSKIKYLKSSGTQYIDTGIKPTEKISCEVEFFLDFDQASLAAGWQIIAGGDDGNTVNSLKFGFNQSTQIMTFQKGASYGDLSSKVVMPIDIHKITNVNGLYAVDKNVVMNWSVSSFTGNHNIYLFGCNENGSFADPASICITSFKLYNDGVLALDLVPAKDTNNVACLYDEVSQDYFYNAGTGTFTYGER